MFVRPARSLLTQAIFLLLAPHRARAQDGVAQPAQAAADQAAASQPAAGPSEAPGHVPSYVMEPSFQTTVMPLFEDQPIGAYAQPRWTATRRFPTTRVYVIPKGTMTLEYWLETKADLGGKNATRHRSSYEAEMGLGHRLQLDLYLSTEQLGKAGALDLLEEKVELRYAFANWGVIPGNPTLYLEWVRANAGSPRAEGKLLFGGEIASGWHWGANLVYEREVTGADQEGEYAVTGAVAGSVIDYKLSLGAEVQLEATDKTGDRFSFEDQEILAGPSLQWRPVPPMHVDLVALFGAEHGSGETTPLAEPTIVVGWEL